MILAGIITYLLSVAGVTAVCGTRIYPNVAPEDDTRPAAILRRISTERELCLDGSTGQYAIPLVQVDCYGDVFSDAANLANQVRLAINAYTGPLGTFTCLAAGVNDESDDYEPPIHADEQGLHKVTLDVFIGHRE